jgi:uncharacterized membrane protein
MTPARAVPRPAGRLAVAGGLALVVAAALYAFGRTHTPAYAMGLFGQHGVAVITRAASWGEAIYLR